MTIIAPKYSASSIKLLVSFDKILIMIIGIIIQK